MKNKIFHTQDLCFAQTCDMQKTAQEWRDNMRNVKYAGIQMQCSRSVEENIAKADKMVREAAANGAQIILLPELFERQYFCQERNYDYYAFATSVDENPAVKHFQKVAAELQVVLPISFYERDINVFYNTVAVIDADGSVLGIYRKTHIPDDHYYQEKFYFTPGDTGFKVYPTAIGSEPILEVDSMPHWRRCMQGHSACNIVPVVAANRIGEEKVAPSEANGHQESSLIFYGSSFVTDATGEIVTQASRDKEEIVYGESDLDADADLRVSWGLFRDRRPEIYKSIR